MRVVRLLAAAIDQSVSPAARVRHGGRRRAASQKANGKRRIGTAQHVASPCLNKPGCPSRAALVLRAGLRERACKMSTPLTSGSGRRSGAGTSATRCRGTARGSTYEITQRQAFCRWPVHGNVLEMLLEGRLELGEHVLLEPDVWLTAPAPGRMRIGGGSFLNLGVKVAAVELVEIGEHCMFANHCFVTDGNHRFDDPDRPVPWRASPPRARPASATTSGAAPTSSSRAA